MSIFQIETTETIVLGLTEPAVIVDHRMHIIEHARGVGTAERNGDRRRHVWKIAAFGEKTRDRRMIVTSENRVIAKRRLNFRLQNRLVVRFDIRGWEDVRLENVRSKRNRSCVART